MPLSDMFRRNQEKPQDNSKDQPGEPPQGKPKEEPTGLDKFAALFDNSKNTNDKANSKERFDLKALFQNEEFVGGLRKQLPQVIQSSISDQTRQKLQSGDGDGLMDLITEATSAVYMQALQHGAYLSEMALDDKLSEANEATSSLVDKRLQDHDLYSKRPQLQNPIVRAGTEALVSRLREQHPNITSEEIDAQLQDYIGELAKELGVKPSSEEPSENNSSEQGTNWLESLGLEVPEPASKE